MYAFCKSLYQFFKAYNGGNFPFDKEEKNKKKRKEKTDMRR